MNIKVNWHQPITLVDGEDENLIYSCENYETLPEESGVYIFARTYGDNVEPLYVGRAGKLKRRIGQQFNNVKLMNGIRKFQNGGRILLIGELDCNGKQDPEKILDVLEPTLIEHFLSEGFELLNVQGTKRPVHEINFSGNQTTRKIIPNKMYARKNK
jgi:hypothetical protein